MAGRHKEYKMVTGSPRDMRELVNDLLKDGWNIWGPPLPFYNEGEYTQAMVLPAEKEEPNQRKAKNRTEIKIPKGVGV